MLEKVYRRVTSSGAASIVCGIISILAGVATGVVLIVSGAKLLASRTDMMDL